MIGPGAAFGPITDYLPHRPPMLLIDQIVEVTEPGAVCRATVAPDCVFAIDGIVHPSATIEFVAQACAIYVGVRDAQTGGAPRLGMIMACREIEFAVDSLAVGDVLTIAVTKVFGQHHQAAFKATVTRGDTLCATLQLSVVDATALAAADPAGAAG